MTLNLPLGMLSLTALCVLLLSCFLLSSLHPLPLVLVVMSLSAITGVMLSSLGSIWFMLAMMLIFLGGLMVVFAYITTLASDDKVVVAPPTFPVMVVGGTVPLALIFSSPPVNYLTLSTLYFSGAGSVMVFLTLYLLTTLLVTVKMTQTHKGALSNWAC